MIQERTSSANPSIHKYIATWAISREGTRIALLDTWRTLTNQTLLPSLVTRYSVASLVWCPPPSFSGQQTATVILPAWQSNNSCS